MKKIVLILVIIFTYSLSFAGTEDFIVKFGKLKKDSSGRYFVYSETTKIPLLLKNSGFRFGFTVEHKKGNKFTGYYIDYLPVPPKTLTGDYKFHKNEDSGKKYKSNKRNHYGYWWTEWWFDEGDPLGECKVEIYVNEELLRVIHYTVIPGE